MLKVEVHKFHKPVRILQKEKDIFASYPIMTKFPKNALKNCNCIFYMADCIFRSRYLFPLQEVEAHKFYKPVRILQTEIEIFASYPITRKHLRLVTLLIIEMSHNNFLARYLSDGSICAPLREQFVKEINWLL